MNIMIMNRVIDAAKCILEKKGTVRSIASVFNVSKSTIHKDLTERLMEIDISLYKKVRELLDYNKKVRHIRGGKSTQLKYAKHS